MTDNEITAQQFLAMVSKWPREAWPERIRGYHPEGFYWELETVPPGEKFKALVWIDFVHAISLFEIAGLRWLMDHGNTECLSIVSYEKPPNQYAIELDEFQDRTMRNRQQLGFFRAEGPTLLSAIDAAIQSTKEAK